MWCSRVGVALENPLSQNACLPSVIWLVSVCRPHSYSSTNIFFLRESQAFCSLTKFCNVLRQMKLGIRYKNKVTWNIVGALIFFTEYVCGAGSVALEIYLALWLHISHLFSIKWNIPFSDRLEFFYFFFFLLCWKMLSFAALWNLKQYCLINHTFLHAFHASGLIC